MSAGPAYVLAVEAQDDIEGALLYLLENAGAAVAERFRDRFYESFALLSEQPLLGTERPAVFPAPTRFWVISKLPYLVIYQPTDPLRILRVWDTRQDPAKLIGAGLSALADDEQKSRLERLALEALDRGESKEYSQEDFDDMRAAVDRELEKRDPSKSK